MDCGMLWEDNTERIQEPIGTKEKLFRFKVILTYILKEAAETQTWIDFA